MLEIQGDPIKPSTFRRLIKRKVLQIETLLSTFTLIKLFQLFQRLSLLCVKNLDLYRSFWICHCYLCYYNSPFSDPLDFLTSIEISNAVRKKRTKRLYKNLLNLVENLDHNFVENQYFYAFFQKRKNRPQPENRFVGVLKLSLHESQRTTEYSFKSHRPNIIRRINYIHSLIKIHQKTCKIRDNHHNEWRKY